MIEEAGRETARSDGLYDDAVERLLLAAIPDAHRVATWILRDASTAEDAVQEAIAQAWTRRRSIRMADSASGWFIRIVVNVCRDELRRRRRRPQLAPLGDAAMGMAGADSTASAHEHDDLAAAVARLTDDEQLVLGLRYGRDLTVPQIAALTGIREGTVKSRLHHALEHLQAALDAERRADEQVAEARR